MSFTKDTLAHLWGKITGLFDIVKSDISNLDNKKVDIVEGKSLISDLEIERLSNIENYDDTQLRDIINHKSNISDVYNKQEIDNIITDVISKATKSTSTNKCLICSPEQPADLEKGLWIQKEESDTTPQINLVRSDYNYIVECSNPEKLNPMLNSSISGMMTAVVGSKIYILGGTTDTPIFLKTTDDGSTTAIQCFDTETNTITQCKATLLKPARMTGAIAIGHIIYIFGGYTNGAGIQIYNTTTDTVRFSNAIFSKNIGNIQLSCVLVDGKIHLLFQNYSYIYDPKTDTLVDNGITNSDIGLYSSAVTTTASRHFVLSGKNKTIYEYHTQPEEKYKYSNCVRFDSCLYGGAMIAVGSKLFIFGGSKSSDYNDTTAEDFCSKTIYMYDTENPVDGIISVGSLYKMVGPDGDQARGLTFASTACVNNRCYVFGGYLGRVSGYGYLSRAIYQFNPFLPEDYKTLNDHVPRSLWDCVLVELDDGNNNLFPISCIGSVYEYRNIANVYDVNIISMNNIMDPDDSIPILTELPYHHVDQFGVNE